VLVRAAAGLADEAGSVAVVDEDHRVVLLGERDHLVQLDEVAVHREDAVGHDQAMPLVLVLLELLLQVLHVHVLEGVVMRRAQADAVDERRMDQAIRDHHVVLAEDGLEDAGVRIHAGGEEQRVLGAEELRDLVLQLAMDVLRAADEAHRAHAEAALFEPLVRRRDHVRMRGEAEIVVGAEVQDLLLLGTFGEFDFDLRALRRADEALLLVEALRLDLFDLARELGPRCLAIDHAADFSSCLDPGAQPWNFWTNVTIELTVSKASGVASLSGRLMLYFFSRKALSETIEKLSTMPDEISGVSNSTSMSSSSSMYSSMTYSLTTSCISLMAVSVGPDERAPIVEGSEARKLESS
jgi:hypothetical protein